MEATPDENFQRRPEPQQQALTTGHEERPRFRMCLRETARTASLARLQCTRREESRIDAGMQQLRQNDADALDRKSDKSVKFLQEQDFEIQRLAASRSSPKIEVTKNTYGATCPGSSSAEEATGELCLSVHLKMGSLSSPSCAVKLGADEACGEPGGHGGGYNLQKELEQLKSGPSVGETGGRPSEEHQRTFKDERRHRDRQRSEVRASSRTRTDPVESIKDSGKRADIVYERAASTLDGKRRWGAQRELIDDFAEADSKGERNHRRGGRARCAQDEGGKGRQTERGERNKESKRGRRDVPLRRESSPSTKTKHHQRARIGREIQSSTCKSGFEADETLHVSGKEQYRRKDHADDGARQSSTSGSKEILLWESATERSRGNELLCGNAQKGRGREKADEKRRQKEELRGGGSRREALDWQLNFSRQRRHTSSESKRTLAGEMKQRAADVRRDSLRPYSVTAKEKYSHEIAGRWQGEAQIADERNRPEELCEQPHFAQAATLRRRRSCSTEDSCSGVDNDEKTSAAFESFGGSRRKHCRRSRSHSSDSHYQKSSRQKKERDRSSHQRFVTSTNERKSSDECARPRHHIVTRRSGERDGRSHTQGLSSKELTRRSSREEVVASMLSRAVQLSPSPSPASSSRTTTHHSTDLLVSRDRQSPAPTCRREEDGVASARRFSGYSSRACGGSSEGEAEQRNQTYRWGHKGVVARGSVEGRRDGGAAKQERDREIENHATAQVFSPAVVNSVSTEDAGDGAMGGIQYHREECIASPRVSHHRDDRERRPQEKRDAGQALHERREDAAGKGIQYHTHDPHYRGEKHRHRELRCHPWRSERREEDVYLKQKFHERPLKHKHDENRRRRPSSSWSESSSDRRHPLKFGKDAAETSCRRGLKCSAGGDSGTESRRRRASLDEKTKRSSYVGGNGRRKDGETTSGGADAKDRKRERREDFVRSDGRGKKVEPCDKGDEGGDPYNCWSKTITEAKAAGRTDSGIDEKVRGDERETVKRKEGRGEKGVEDASQRKRRRSEAGRISLMPSCTYANPSSIKEHATSERARAATQQAEGRVRCAETGERQGARRDCSSSREEEATEGRNRKSDCHIRRKGSTHLYTEKSVPPTRLERSGSKEDTVRRPGVNSADEVHRGEGRSRKPTHSKEERHRKSVTSAWAILQGNTSGEGVSSKHQSSAPHCPLTPEEDNCDEPDSCPTKTSGGKDSQDSISHWRVLLEVAGGPSFQEETRRKETQEVKTKADISDDTRKSERAEGEDDELLPGSTQQHDRQYFCSFFFAFLRSSGAEKRLDGQRAGEALSPVWQKQSLRADAFVPDSELSEKSCKNASYVLSKRSSREDLCTTKGRCNVVDDTNIISRTTCDSPDGRTKDTTFEVSDAEHRIMLIPRCHIVAPVARRSDMLFGNSDGDICPVTSSGVVSGDAAASLSFISDTTRLQDEQLTVQKPAAAGASDSGEETLLAAVPEKTGQNQNKKANSKNKRRTPSRSSCSPGNSASVEGTDSDRQGSFAESRCRKAGTHPGARFDVRCDGTAGDNDCSVSGERGAAIPDPIYLPVQIRPCTRVSPEEMERRAIPGSSSFDSHKLPITLHPVAATIAVAASPDRSLPSDEAEGIPPSSKINNLTGALVISREDFASNTRGEENCKNVAITGGAGGVETRALGRTATETSCSSGTATAPPLASRSDIPQLLKGLASSLSVVRRGHNSNQCGSKCSDGHADMPQTSQTLSSQSELNHSVSVHLQPFPPPKILSCVSPLQSQASFSASSPPPPPPLPLARGAAAREPSKDPPQRTCPFVRRAPSVPSVTSLNLRSSYTSSFLHVSTSASARSDAGMSAHVASVHAEVQADYCPLVHPLRTRQPTGESRALFAGGGAAPGAALAERSSSLLMSLPHSASPTPPPPPPADVGAAFDSALQPLAHGLAHSCREMRNYALTSAVSQEQRDGSLAATSADATRAAATVASRLTADRNAPSECIAVGTEASSELEKTCMESGGVTEPPHHRQEVQEPSALSLASKGSSSSTTVKTGRTAAAQEVVAITSFGRTFEPVDSFTYLQTSAGEMRKNFGDVADVRRESRHKAGTHRSPQAAEPSKHHRELHEGGVSGSPLEQSLISKFNGVGTGEPVSGPVPPQHVQETPVQVPGTCRDPSQAKAFSREQLLGGVSIKRVKRTRQSQDVAAGSWRTSADLPTMVTFSSSAAATAVEQQADTRSTPESGRADGTHVETPDVCMLPLKEHHRDQLTSAASAQCTSASVDHTKVAQKEDTNSTSRGERRLWRPREGGFSDFHSSSVYVPSSASKAAVADTQNGVLRNTSHFMCCEGTRTPQFQKRKDAEVASAAAAGAAAAVRQQQRDEQVARFLQELQARYTVLGDEEAAAASTSGAVVAYSGRSQSESHSDSSDTNNSSLETTSKRSGSSSSSGRRGKSSWGEIGVSGDQVDSADVMQPYNSSVETAEVKYAGDRSGGASTAHKTTTAEKYSSVWSRGAAAYRQPGSCASDTDSSVSSFFSPSSSSSESSHSPVSRRRRHPLRVLDQERRQFFRAAAAAACKLHRWEHDSKLSSVAASRREHAPVNEARVTGCTGTRGGSCTRASSDSRIQVTADTAELHESGCVRDTPSRSVCVWLRALLLMRKAVRRAKWANRRALAAQGAAAAAVAAAAAGGVFRSYMFDEQQRVCGLRNRAFRKSQTLKKGIDNQNCAAEHDKGVVGGLSGSVDRLVPCELQSTRCMTFSDVNLKRERNAVYDEDSVTHPKGNPISEIETETSEHKTDPVESSQRVSRSRAAARTCQPRADWVQLHSFAIGRHERKTSFSVGATLAVVPAQGPQVGSPATAAAVLQKMPKTKGIFPPARRVHRRRLCNSSNRKRGASASTQNENVFCSKIFSSANRQSKPIQGSCKSSPASAGVGGSGPGMPGVYRNTSGAQEVVNGDQYQGDAQVHPSESRGLDGTFLARYGTKATNRSAFELPHRLEQRESFPVGLGRHEEPKVTGNVCTTATALKRPHRTSAGRGGLAGGNEGSGGEVSSTSGRGRRVSVIGGEIGGVGVRRNNSWYGSDVSSTRSSSASRSPSVASADDMYETVDSGCAGLFLPTHTLEIGKKPSNSTSSERRFSCLSPSCSKWKNTVLSVAYHGSLPVGAAGLEGGEICVCSLRDMRPTCVIPSPQQAKHCSAAATTAAVECVSWKHSAQATAAGEEYLLAVGRRGGLVEVRDVRMGESGRPAISWEAHAGPVEKLKFLSTAACVTSSPTEMYVRFWDLRGRGTTSCSVAPVEVSRYGSGSYTSCRCSAAPCSTTLDPAVQPSCLVCPEEGTRAPFSQSRVDSRLVRSVKMNSGVSAFAISPDEELLAVACLCGEVQVLSLPLGPEPCEQLLSFPSVHELDCFSSLSFSRNGRGLLVCGERQFTPRMRAATKLMSFPFCEMWDLQDTKQRRKMLVCASFWKHMRRYGTRNRKPCAVAPLLRRGPCLPQEQPHVQQGYWPLQAQQLRHVSALPSVGKEEEDTWASTESPSFELPLSFFPSCVAISVDASSGKSFSSLPADCVYPCGANEGEVHSAQSRSLDQRCVKNVSKSVPRAAQSESTSYVLYLNSRLSNPRRGRVVTELREETTKAGHSFLTSHENVWSQTQTLDEKLHSAVSTDETRSNRDDLEHGGRDLFQRCRQRTLPVRGHFPGRRPNAKLVDFHPAGAALADAGKLYCCSGGSEVFVLNWAQGAARLFCGPLGGDFRWPCRRFVCDLWRDKVVGVGGPLHLIGAFKQWDASTGYLDSCTVNSVTQNPVSSVVADPGGGPTLLTGGRSAVSGHAELTMWGYFTVPQMEALGLVKL